MDYNNEQKDFFINEILSLTGYGEEEEEAGIDKLDYVREFIEDKNKAIKRLYARVKEAGVYKITMIE